MSINTISIIAGALSFSVALQWNKASNEVLSRCTRNDSAVYQALFSTCIVVLSIFIINIVVYYYNSITNNVLKKSTIDNGTKDFLKVKLWNDINKIPIV